MENSEKIKRELVKLEKKLGVEFTLEESEIALVDKLLVDKLSNSSITRKEVQEELYLPIIIFISEVYRENYGGELVSSEKNRLNPSCFRCSNGKDALWFLAVYMDFQASLAFLGEKGYVEFIYSELKTECKS
ncbi:hypothetical protein [Neolewinella agarilytica]|uniref:Uncharacterized protein n=1 Tax=Neolewinella agarilytica TaxID=478744 RepID=A0A1H9NS17_9BACT|nr:hypothetical protein [Neolewinella agarilytica]SER38746.1 hypothetical protein SAMN05444359_13916 [Neolewinella agarilytica]